MDKNYLLNEDISANIIRISGERGTLSRSDALQRAENEECDLIQIAEKDGAAICVIKDFNKFLYELNKRDRGNKPKSKPGLKEIKLGLNIGEHDIEHKSKKAIELMEEGSRVKISLFLSGREILRSEDAFKLVNKFIDKCQPCTYDKAPKLDGKIVSVVIFKK